MGYQLSYTCLVSGRRYYPFFYAPLASDMLHLPSTAVTQCFDLGSPWQPLQQLLAVLPASSAKAAGLPGCLRALMTEPDSPVIEYYPEEFEIDINGYAAHQLVVCSVNIAPAVESYIHGRRWCCCLS